MTLGFIEFQKSSRNDLKWIMITLGHTNKNEDYENIKKLIVQDGKKA